jgi:hypothetical protein
VSVVPLNKDGSLKNVTAKHAERAKLPMMLTATAANPAGRKSNPPAAQEKS